MVQPVQSSSAYVPSSMVHDPNLTLRVACVAAAAFGLIFSCIAAPEIAVPLSLCFIVGSAFMYEIFRETVGTPIIRTTPLIRHVPVIHETPIYVTPPYREQRPIVFLPPIAPPVVFHQNPVRREVVPPPLVSGSGARAPVGRR